MRLHFSLAHTFWTVIAFEIVSGFPVEFVCVTEDNRLGGCFSSCSDVEDLGTLLNVSPADAPRARPCEGGHRCCALPVSDQNDVTESSAELVSDECGLEFSRSFRIVNGKRAPEGSHPWLVALYRENAFQCGGALITNRYVLTASHCFRPDDEKEKLSDAAFFAVMGTNNLTDTKKRVVRRVCRVATHAKYVANNFHNDIAIVELSEPVDITGKRLRTLCLPEGQEGELMNISDRRLTIAGWGSVDPFQIVLTNVLMQIEITGGSIANCSKQFSSFLDFDPKIQFCAGDVRKNVKDACQGDSGGPLIQRRDKDGKFEIVGITSFGVGCATEGLPFGGYATVSSYLSWINITVTALEKTAKPCLFEEVKPTVKSDEV